MEPPPFGDGNAHRRNGGVGDDDLPSMEPPPFGDGNVWRLETRDEVIVLQWSHRPSAMETSRDRRRRTLPADAFNGATALRRWKPDHSLVTIPDAVDLQWSHRPSAMETGIRESSNLLIWSLQWSHRPSAMETISGGNVTIWWGAPSMEPPPFGDGNQKPGGYFHGFSITLQWSHRPSAMETGPR